MHEIHLRCKTLSIRDVSAVPGRRVTCDSPADACLGERPQVITLASPALTRDERLLRRCRLGERVSPTGLSRPAVYTTRLAIARARADGTEAFCGYHASSSRRMSRRVASDVLPLAEATLNEAPWLILPVVICLSQRLSHACLSACRIKVKPRMAH